jgi:hypothetical protein
MNRAGRQSMNYGRGWMEQGRSVLNQANRELDSFDPWKAAAGVARMQGYGEQFNRGNIDRRLTGNEEIFKSIGNRQFNRQAQGGIYDTGMAGMAEKSRMRAAIGSQFGSIGSGIYQQGFGARVGGIEGMMNPGMSIGQNMAGAGSFLVGQHYGGQARGQQFVPSQSVYTPQFRPTFGNTNQPLSQPAALGRSTLPPFEKW